ncbi:16692_t:CDS:1, partial [Acaulospora morrowiae]
PEDWLREFRRYIVASRINITPGIGGVAGRAEILGLAISCFAGPVLTWYETRVKGRNWKCNNLSDNLGVVDLNAVRALAAGNNNNQIGGLNTAGEFRNKAATEIGRIDAGVATGADIIPIGTWEKDWSIAGGEPTNDIPVAPNTGGFPATTITPNITLEQFLYLIRTAYTSVEHLKQMAVFGQLVQGNMTVEQFSARIKKI